MSITPDALRAEADLASAGLPALILSAERLASALTMGAHGQRRPGTGEDFWQYRPAMVGDSASNIDWRRSGRSDAQFVRDREAQLAQSAAIWLSSGQGMDHSGGPDRPSKRARGQLLTLSLAMALLASGEKVALAGETPRSGRLQGDRIAQALINAQPLAGDDDSPPESALRHGQRMILIDDFLGDPEPTLAYLGRAAAMGISGVMLQILDPDEESFPFSGAVLFHSVSGGMRHDTRDAKGLREAYLARLADRRALLSRAAAQAGWHFGTHDTANAPNQALTWLWTVLEG